MTRMRDDEAMARTAKEETVLFLFRGLSQHQQREVIMKLRALIDANIITQSLIGKRRLDPTSNEVVRAAFKDIPPPAGRTAVKKRAKKPGRPPGAPLDDYPEPEKS